MEKICRTCLRSSTNLLPLFDDTGLPHKIATICSVHVSETDSLPKQICAECVINVNLSYNFRRVIINSDIQLKRRLLCSPVRKRIPANEQSVTNPLKRESNETPSPPETIDNTTTTGTNVNESTTELNVFQKYQNTEIKVRRVIASSEVRRNIRWRIQTPLLGINRKRLYRCKICDFTTTEYTKGYNHKRSHFITKSMCNICGKTIRTDNLKKHIGTHTDPPVACKECGKVFKNSESLRSHVLIHKGIEITCEFCGQIFKYRGGYKRHVRKQHTVGPNRKVKCPLCEKLFYEKTDLKKHLRSHTGERPYPCEYCKKGFSSSHALKTHIRQHTNERPYACEFCPMAFPQKVSLRTHLKSKHPEQTEKTT